MVTGKKPATRRLSLLVRVTTARLPTNAGHPFFEHLNRVLKGASFDAFVEGFCAAFYAARMGRPGLPPGRYYRLLIIGYFEGLSSERGIAWRMTDSLSRRSLLDLDLTEAVPDHSTLSPTRRLIDVATHVAVSTSLLERLADAGLVVRHVSTLGPLAATKARPRRVDYEYERAGTASVFLLSEPLAGRRQATARARCTKADWAVEVAGLLEGRCAECTKVTLVCDNNLNTHTKGAFYEVFEPVRARELVRRLELCHTPKHGSWLNIPANDLSAMTRQCLPEQRIGDLETENVRRAQILFKADADGQGWSFTARGVTAATKGCR